MLSLSLSCSRSIAVIIIAAESFFNSLSLLNSIWQEGHNISLFIRVLFFSVKQRPQQ